MSDSRNLIDHFWYWKTEDIKARLDTLRHNFSILCCNWQNDFNIAGVVRNSNAFLAKQIYFWGKKKYDKRGTVGTHNYENIEVFQDKEGLDKLCSSHTLIGVDNVAGAVPLDNFVWPANTLMAFGQEQIGLPEEVLCRASNVVYIRQFGSVRSLNAACASAICMYDWCAKNSPMEEVI